MYSSNTRTTLTDTAEKLLSLLSLALLSLSPLSLAPFRFQTRSTLQFCWYFDWYFWLVFGENFGDCYTLLQRPRNTGQRPVEIGSRSASYFHWSFLGLFEPPTHTTLHPTTNDNKQHTLQQSNRPPNNNNHHLVVYIIIIIIIIIIGTPWEIYQLRRTLTMPFLVDRRSSPLSSPTCCCCGNTTCVWWLIDALKREEHNRRRRKEAGGNGDSFIQGQHYKNMRYLLPLNTTINQIHFKGRRYQRNKC